MLSLLLDEQISPQVVAAVAALNADVPVVSIYDWRAGALTGTDDALVLQGAKEDGLTLVTYDLRTIPPILAEWGASGRPHGGVMFVDDRSIAPSDFAPSDFAPSDFVPSDFGGLARALLFCWEAQGAWDWADRIVYLRPA